ncbi:MAG: hypothetical protein ACI85I_001304 [Arenicella sp.]|jgi:hypothetical protein
MEEFKWLALAIATITNVVFIYINYLLRDDLLKSKNYFDVALANHNRDIAEDKSYLEEKGKGTAQKEDLSDLTQLVEDIRLEQAKKLDDYTRKYADDRAYLEQLGQDIATKESIEEITDLVKKVESTYNVELAKLSSRLSFDSIQKNRLLEKEFKCLESVYKNAYVLAKRATNIPVEIGHFTFIDNSKITDIALFKKKLMEEEQVLFYSIAEAQVWVDNDAVEEISMNLMNALSREHHKVNNLLTEVELTLWKEDFPLLKTQIMDYMEQNKGISEVSSILSELRSMVKGYAKKITNLQD